MSTTSRCRSMELNVSVSVFQKNPSLRTRDNRSGSWRTKLKLYCWFCIWNAEVPTFTVSLTCNWSRESLDLQCVCGGFSGSSPIMSCSLAACRLSRVLIRSATFTHPTSQTLYLPFPFQVAMVMMWVLLFFPGLLCIFPLWSNLFLLPLHRPYFEMKAKYYLQLEVRDGLSALT